MSQGKVIEKTAAYGFYELFEKNKKRCKKLNSSITTEDFFFKVVPVLQHHQNIFRGILLMHHDPIALECEEYKQEETIIIKASPIFLNSILTDYIFTEVTAMHSR